MHQAYLFKRYALIREHKLWHGAGPRRTDAATEKMRGEGFKTKPTRRGRSTVSVSKSPGRATSSDRVARRQERRVGRLRGGRRGLASRRRVPASTRHASTRHASTRHASTRHASTRHASTRRSRAQCCGNARARHLTRLYSRAASWSSRSSASGACRVEVPVPRGPLREHLNTARQHEQASANKHARSTSKPVPTNMPQTCPLTLHALV